MGKLQVLPANLANMIAAGEVVQRPASVVKELMENSVDAGADKMNVVITDSGRTLIQVIDNGCGMSPSDAVLCFERHATSKISSPSDLEKILTYGFRGEALASIAAISEVTLKTRREADELATQVSVSDSGQVRTASVSAPKGTSFMVRNIFYNTPARRKFLKSDSVEFRHIVDEFTRVAIPHPEIAFTLTHNGRDIFVLGKAKSLKFRILDLIGANVTGDIVDIDASTSVAHISGFVGKPDSARKSLGNQFFFVDGRFFRSPYLHKAVMKAYEDMIPEGVTPSYFIFLDIDPTSIDVNIHPTKTEIKFEDDSILFQVLYACVKEVLGRNSFGASIDFEAGPSLSLPQTGMSFDEYKGQLSESFPEPDPDYDPFKSPALFPGTSPGHESGLTDFSSILPEKQCPPRKCLVLQGKYVLTPSNSGLMAVNIRRAMQRILYERALKALESENGHMTQVSLFPVQVQVGVSARTLFDENAAVLARLGFDIRPFGTDCVVVEGVPEGYSCESGKVEQMIYDLELILSDTADSLHEIMIQNLAEKIATLGAMHAGQDMDPFMAGNLLEELFSGSNTEVTPGGKRIVTIISTEEIDKRFQ